MKLFDTIRSAGGGKFVAALAGQAGIEPAQAEEALRAMLPEVGSAIRRAEESGSGAGVVVEAIHDERYARYLDRPETLSEPGAVSDGERVLKGVMDDAERGALIGRVATETGRSKDEVRTMLPLVATLAMAALGQTGRDASAEIPWFGTRPGDRFGAPLLNALTALFEHEDGPKSR
jgi:hypothetical protein